ncbi:MAG: hypothetical protein ACTH8E_08680 [Brochothrix thermosphacta]|uniref:hypothetical protein n=1 Tax=Brochothrix thermosphacta TaxID=2756 RepID=UPI000A1B6AD9|nr:hypothetical protein FM106_05930 [Brachybacterium faecium]
MTQKVILKKQKESKATKLVFIDSVLHEKILQMKQETGIPINKLVEIFLEFGINNCVVEED